MDFYEIRNDRLKTLFHDLIGECDLKNNIHEEIKSIYSNQNILEISPCFFPLLDKCDSFNLYYCDRVEFETIVEREENNDYRKKLNLDVLPIDFVWQDGMALKLCSPHNQYDLIVASHVMEHVPDYLSWLWELYTMLKIGGEVRLVLPDAHKSGEFIRTLSTAAYAYECFVNKQTRSSPSQVFDGLLSITEWNGKLYKRDLLNYKRWYKFDETVRLGIESFERHIDIHCWAWTPESFEDNIKILTESKLIPFDFIATKPGKMPGAVCDEFSVIFRKSKEKLTPPNEVLNYWAKQTENLKEKIPSKNNALKKFLNSIKFHRRIDLK